jgi:hypothetical protein
MPSRSWQFRIDDIVEAINKIERYTHGIDFASWQNDEKTVDAVIRNLEVIGEASSHLERPALILEKTQTQCYAWALIPNHFHLLLRTGATPLSNVMRRLMTGYAVCQE